MLWLLFFLQMLYTVSDAWVVNPPCACDLRAHRVLPGDRFYLDEAGCPVVVERAARVVAAVLVGNSPTTFTDGKRTYYKAVPFDRSWPPLLVASPWLDKQRASFRKTIPDVYAAVQPCDWVSGRAPACFATVVAQFGPTDELAAYFQYQVCARQLCPPWPRGLRKPLVSEEKRYARFEDRRDRLGVVTVDHRTTVVRDDAVGLHGDTLSVYIAHVAFWLDQVPDGLGWAPTGRVNTVYVPGSEREWTLFPRTLERLASLNADHDRDDDDECQGSVALAFDFDLAADGCPLRAVRNVRVRVADNLCYDDPSVRTLDVYRACERVVQTSPAIVYDPACPPRNVVARLMHRCNREAAQRLRSANVPAVAHVSSADGLDHARYKWAFQPLTSASPPDALAPCTSPLRRLADVVNQACLQQCLADNPFPWRHADAVAAFCARHTSVEGTEAMVAHTASARRLQFECGLLQYMATSVAPRVHVGRVVDVGPDNAWWAVHLPVLKLTVRVRNPDRLPADAAADVRVELHLFHNDARFSQKVRGQLVV